MAETAIAPSFPATFDAAVITGGYQTETCWNAYVNGDTLCVWEFDDWLPRGKIVERYSDWMQARFTKYKGTPDQPRTWGDAGNLIHHALRLGIIEEQAGPDGERGWRLLHREMRWVVEGTGHRKQAVQVRGLPPSEQAARDRKEEALAKLRATLDRKARAKADPEIARLVESTLRYDPDTVVPERWSTRGPAPAWTVGTRLDACAGVVRKAHHAAEIDRHAVTDWIRALKHEQCCAMGRPRRRAAERAAQSPHAEIPEDDTAALEALL
ncbi:hypothetical protein [Methylobacterium ajmalii]|uniref:hypothetical protein n=1 Tax=Methylobacterium ajmalii TaxID=2738439 RepID=UPI00190A9F00|nr:hypothetical protein [Methylobacterium ajmalii]MBK3397766.1 hypothetical protein [Methylobacterium ajmalii]MBK3408463.1 hypothetical protein [Methylobacterium ajmalii]MBK3424136.1 hypothetical protein [Methylobacterium ajmalii]MBZ6416613.1 hypothetical protein [Methylobacterium sp.]